MKSYNFILDIVKETLDVPLVRNNIENQRYHIYLQYTLITLTAIKLYRTVCIFGL